MYWKVEGLHHILSVFVSLHKPKMSDDLDNYLSKIGIVIFLVVLNYYYQDQIIGSYVYQHCALEVYLSTLLTVWRGTC